MAQWTPGSGAAPVERKFATLCGFSSMDCIVSRAVMKGRTQFFTATNVAVECRFCYSGPPATLTSVCHTPILCECACLLRLILICLHVEERSHGVDRVPGL